jgi:hypothetical protein
LAKALSTAQLTQGKISADIKREKIDRENRNTGNGVNFIMTSFIVMFPWVLSAFVDARHYSS